MPPRLRFRHVHPRPRRHRTVYAPYTLRWLSAIRPRRNPSVASNRELGPRRRVSGEQLHRHAFHPRGRRSLPERALQRIQGLERARRPHLHRAVRQVPHVSDESELLRHPMRPPPKPDPLNASEDVIRACLHHFPTQKSLNTTSSTSSVVITPRTSSSADSAARRWPDASSG